MGLCTIIVCFLVVQPGIHPEVVVHLLPNMNNYPATRPMSVADFLADHAPNHS